MAGKRPDLFAPRAASSARTTIAYEFVLEALDTLPISTRPMFGATAVYVGDQIVFILRKKGDRSDGVWLAYEGEREPEVMRALPNLVRIEALGNVRFWRMLAASSPRFEDDVLTACRLVREGGLLGKVPDRAKATKPRRTTERKAEPRKPKPRARGTRQEVPPARAAARRKPR